MKLTKASTDADSKDIAHHPGMYREFRSLDIRSRTVVNVVDMSCPGCGEVWALREGLLLVGGSVIDLDTGQPALVTCYLCGGAWYIEEGGIETAASHQQAG